MPRPHYPWAQGDELFAEELNAAIANMGRDIYNARDFGVTCDGVTDEGAQLNAALMAIPPGTTLYVPGSVYTTQTIIVRDGRRLEMPPGTLVRPVPNDGATWRPTHAIIGSPTLSPVVLVWSSSSPEGGLTNVQITRNGAPTAGTIGLQCIGGNQKHWRVYSWNHAVGIQCGAPAATPVLGQYVAITTAFDHCLIWQCYENFLYLINAPETTCYDMRFGCNGSIDPPGATSLVTIDGDNNTGASAGTTNTATFLRCQFNTGGDPLYSLRFFNVNSDGIFKVIGCYSGGAKNNFIFIDPNCSLVQMLSLNDTVISPLHGNETLLSDTGKKLVGFIMRGCHVGGGVAQPAAAFAMSGTQAQIIGNKFNGPFTVQMDAMLSGCFVGNTVSTALFTGAFTGPFVVASNSVSILTQTATGGIRYVEPFGNYGSQLKLGQTGQAGRVDFARGTDGQFLSWVGLASATTPGTFSVSHGTGTPVVAIDAANVSGAVSLRTNSVERFGVTDTTATVSVPLVINASGPTLRSGTGAATGTQPKGSLWMRTDGAAGSTLYVSQGAGTWLPVAGV